jgi:hypothetical protein
MNAVSPRQVFFFLSLSVILMAGHLLLLPFFVTH